jgi:hypothetical protein
MPSKRLAEILVVLSVPGMPPRRTALSPSPHDGTRREDGARTWHVATADDEVQAMVETGNRIKFVASRSGRVFSRALPAIGIGRR